MQLAKRGCPARKNEAGDFLEFENTEGVVLALRAFRALCEEVGSPYAYQALRALDTGLFRKFLLRGFDPGAYRSWFHFGCDYQIYNYLRKFSGIIALTDLEAEALNKFHHVEAVNRRYNTLFKNTEYIRTVSPLLLVAARKISEVLGPFSYDKVLQHCEWSGGSTTSIRLADATIPNKMMEGSLTVTPGLYQASRILIANDPHWQEARFPAASADTPFCLLDVGLRIQSYGVFTTVPKDWKTLRAIEKQPTLSMFFQKGVGTYIRKRLRKYGIDLNSQTHNQFLARGACSMGLATLDLSNASDSLCRELVRQLLPMEWYDWLDKCRTHEIRLPNHDVVPLQRFSAMGNGYTFELESLIFYAITYAAVQLAGGNTRNSVVSVYGDDIIVDACYANAVMTALEKCGFSVNTDKSFTKGLFYESCGTQVFNGVDVTPVFQKKPIEKQSVEVLNSANRLLDFGYRMGRCVFINKLVRSPWLLVTTHGDSFRERRFAIKYAGPFHGDGSGYLRVPNFRPNRAGLHTFVTTTLIESYGSIDTRGRQGLACYANYLRSRHRGGLQNSPLDYLEQPSISVAGKVKQRDMVLKESVRIWYDNPDARRLPVQWGHFTLIQ